MDELEEYSLICRASELKENKGERFIINNTDIAVFKVNGKFFVVSNICPHQHASNIYEGFIEDECVVCPLHGWTFRLENGNLTGGSKGLDSFPVKVIDDKVYALVKEKKLNW